MSPLLRRFVRPRGDRANASVAAGAPTDDEEERPSELERAIGWFDERTGVAGIARGVLRKVFPDHWSFLLGELALFCFVILVATGTYLTFFFVPSGEAVVYDGPYVPLQGREVSAAFDSTMRLSFEVRAGLVMRQVHHWTALVFVGAIVIHAIRVFFSGAFRRPRELNWLIGFTLMLLAMGEGLTGYSLPDDLLSGTGVRITYSAALSIPFLGPPLAFLIFGGEFPTHELISRFFVFHIFLLPALLAGGIGTHILLLFLQRHTQWPGGRRTETNVVGWHFWPVQVFRSLGLFFLTAAVMALLGGLVQINPIWSYGPFVPYLVSSPAQPDWYFGWLDGALRIFPGFEPTILGVTIPASFIPGVVIPGALFTLIALWPLLEPRFTGDKREHHILQRPWEAPRRTAAGVAVLTYFAVLTIAGGNDVLSMLFQVQVEGLTVALRILLIAGPIAAALITYALCRNAARRAAEEATDEEPVERRVVSLRRTPTGGFEEVVDEP